MSGTDDPARPAGARVRRGSRSATIWRRARARTTAYLPAWTRDRRPRTRIHTGPAIPGLAVRLITVVVGLLCAATVTTGQAGWVIIAALLIGLAWAPGSITGSLLVIALALQMVVEPGPPPVWRAPLLVAAVPLLLLLAAIAGQAAWTARVELKVLAQPWRRYLGVQAFAQPLAAAGGLLAGSGLVLPPVMALAGLVLLGVVAFWVPSLGPPRQRH